MNTDACTRYFTVAPGLAATGRLSGCIACPAGAMHSIFTPPEPALESVGVCIRCRRDPLDGSQYRSTRTGRLRMVRGGLLCVSCFNREREVILGRNARNTTPKAPALPKTKLGHIVDGKVTVVHLPAVKDAVEGALTILRKAGGKGTISWVGAGVQRLAASECDSKPKPSKKV